MAATSRKPREGSCRDRRSRLILLGFLLVFGLILFRLERLQIRDAAFYDALAHDQHLLSAEIAPLRGEIFLQNGNEGMYPIAVNRAYPTVYVVPRDVEDVDATVRLLSDVLGRDEGVIRERFADRDDPFEIIERKVEKDRADKIVEADLPGVFVTEETFRFYPGEELASQTVGFVGAGDGKISGRYGVEASWEDVLAGSRGAVHQERDASGRWISTTDREYIPERNGSDLILTIDANAQYELERILRDRVERHDADGASAIVLEVGTGRILAMANVPTFDPNRYGEVSDMAHFINPVVSHNYEAGSVFKPITMAIGIDDGKIAPSTTYVDPGVIREGGYEIMNSEEKTYGEQTMTQVLEESINTGTIFVQRQVGNKTFREYVERFGFGEETGVALPGEARGNLSNLEHLGRDIHFYTASFGQGISMTLLQLALAYDVIANGGNLMTPHIVDETRDSDGIEKRNEAESVRRVIAEDTAKQVREMLASVVESGHGKNAGVEGYRVGGKTGTAQVAKRGERGYSDEETIGTFAGLAPVDAPEFVVAVKVRNPKDVIWAESSAAPAFGEIMRFLLDYYHIEPDRNE